MAKNNGLSRSKKNALKSNSKIITGRIGSDSNPRDNGPGLIRRTKSATVNASSKTYLSQDHVEKFFSSVVAKKKLSISTIDDENLNEEAEIQEQEPLVLCPICGLSLNGFDLPARNSHVNMCVEGTTQERVEVDRENEERGGALLTDDESRESVLLVEDDSLKDFSIELDEELFVSQSTSNEPLVPEPTPLKRKWTDADEEKIEDTKIAITAVNKKPKANNSVPTKPNSRASTPKPPRPMPFYKVIEFDQEKVAVDAFNFGSIDKVNKYFLTHFHSDHYMGLGKSWNHGLVYCTEITSRLIQMHLKVDPSIIREIPMNVMTRVDELDVIFLDANHCPGSAIILIGGNWRGVSDSRRRKVILHTGDFRACPRHVDEMNKWIPILRKNDTSHQNYLIDALYLDTTYLNPAYTFPNQDFVLQTCADYCFHMIDKGEIPTFSKRKTIYSYFSRALETKNPTPFNPVIYVGSYTIGKEKLAIHIASRLKCKIFAKSGKKKTLLALQDENLTNLLSDNGLEANVHIVSMHDLNIKGLQEQWQFLKKTFTHLLAFQPTGWTFRGSLNTTTSTSTTSPTTTTSSSSPVTPPFTLSELEKCRKISGNIHIFRVPYSEHSSFNELQFFCKNTLSTRIIPTVNTSNPQSRDKMNHYLNQWH